MMQSSDLGDKGMSHSPRKNKAEALALKSIFYQQVTLSRIIFMLIYRQSAQYSGVLLSSHHCLHSTLVNRIDVQDEINMQVGKFLKNIKGGDPNKTCRGDFFLKDDVVLFQYSQKRIAFILILMLRIHNKIRDITFFQGFSLMQKNNCDQNKIFSATKMKTKFETVRLNVSCIISQYS